MINQLTLNIRLRDDATFENFNKDNNEELITSLKNTVLPLSLDFRFVYIWGRNVGRTHLLQACCQWAAQHSLTSIYVSLKNYQELSPQIFEGIESVFLVCIDDIEFIAGDRQWEESLFHFYNRSLEKNSRLVVSGSSIPTNISFNLKDLRSRLSTGLIYQVKPLNDAQKLNALMERAKARGITLNNDVGSYLLNHYPRNMSDLFNALDRLDIASLESHRKLTIPFIKEVLEN